MSAKFKQPLLSVVVPAYNEGAGLQRFNDSLLKVVEPATDGSYEIIYVDDGSRDNTASLIHDLHAANDRIKLLRLSRNFGKEIAVSAGMHVATGQATLTLDADGQHPVELIPEFLQRWQAGAPVVTGLRLSNQKEGGLKRYGSKLFYGLYGKLTGLKLVAGATDFRIVDAVVRQEFVRLTERRRITRGLIDWLGYQQEYVEFHAKQRLDGEASYSAGKLLKLAIDSVVSLSLSPLYVTAYIGAVVLPVSTLLGLGMIVNALLGDPLSLDATGGAYVMVLMLFLIGILLVSQGIIGLYLSHIHTETQNRPLYIIDAARSAGIVDVDAR